MDCRRDAIPNRLTAAAFALALGGHFARGGFQDVGLSIAGAVLSGAVPLFMYLRGAIGAGDVKLFAALGAALHPLAGLEAEAYAFVAGAVIARRCRRGSGSALRCWRVPRRRSDLSLSIPFP